VESKRGHGLPGTKNQKIVPECPAFPCFWRDATWMHWGKLAIRILLFLFIQKKTPLTSIHDPPSHSHQKFILRDSEINTGT